MANKHSNDDLKRKKRAEANDPIALRQVGKKGYDEGDYITAFEHLSKAAELGDAESHRKLSFMYRDGIGVRRDKKKQVRHLEEAAIGGNHTNHAARYDLGFVEFGGNRRTDRIGW